MKTRRSSTSLKTKMTLAEQLEFAENLIMNSTVATFVLNTSHQVVIWNRACAELTGVKAAEMVGTDGAWRAFYDHKRPVLADFIIDENPAELTAHYTPISRSDLVQDGLQAEGWYRNLNGRDRYIIFNSAPIRDATGKLVAVIETLEEITERKLETERLEVSEARMRTILETALDGIVTINEEGIIESVNSSCRQIFGYGSDELTGKKLSILIPSTLRELHAELITGYLLTGESKIIGSRVEVSARRKDGTPFPAELAVSEVHLGERRIFTAMITDISERRKLEDQHRHSQKMEAIGTLAGGVAHYFNNILTAIIGFGSIMKMKMDDGAPLMADLDQILTAAERAADLTRNLLSYSRQEPLNPGLTDLNNIVSKVDKLLARIIGEDVELVTHLADKSLPIMADVGQIEQILMNLASNARDAMEGEGSLIVSTGEVKLDREFTRFHGYGKPGRYAFLSVSDSGTGIERNTHGRIFEPFFTTKDTGRGTGLGLSIVYGIVKQHNGYINVYSEEGKGTTFMVHFPLAVPAGAETEKKMSSRTDGG